MYQYSADIQRELPLGIALRVGYVGSRSNNLTPSPTGTGTEPINQIAPNYLPLGSALNNSVPNPFYGLPGANGVIGAKTIAQAQLLLPFPEYSTISANMNPAHARYDSLIAKIQKRMSHGLNLLSTITWSRNEDNEYGASSGNARNGFSSSPPTSPQNVYDLDAEWARSSVDVPIRWTGTGTYQFPFGKGKPWLGNNKIMDYVVSGWSVNGTTVIQQGTRYSSTRATRIRESADKLSVRTQRASARFSQAAPKTGSMAISTLRRSRRHLSSRTEICLPISRIAPPRSSQLGRLLVQGFQVQRAIHRTIPSRSAKSLQHAAVGRAGHAV